ncbi:glutamic acid-rich protein [Neltuma alba]|uniref:glutamic acid-rich protein n=1 Tax=Neltuma alba TaxID=207710 RepID=UPI0010A44236|nr:glutamic acid-rich protein [Prosopis alba]
MSRCFPFPPPGYMRNGACSEDLIKSIKLQKERDEAKEQRKKDKRKKKEKRKERKERKEKEANATHHCDDKGKECKLRNLESYRLEKIRAEQGSGCLRKVGDDDNEQIERSGITEEHDQPFSSTEPCCLSDSTQSSNKRKRSTSPSRSDHGTAIKIRLPLRKHREHEELQQDYRAGSTGSKGITKSFNEESRHQFQGQRNSEPEQREYQYIVHTGVDPSTNLKDSERGRMASLYNSLFQNWNACELQLKGFELEEDQDWLSASEGRQTQATKKAKSVNDFLGCSGSSLWPRAQYLPEADIYGLPYTVPF